MWKVVNTNDGEKRAIAISFYQQPPEEPRYPLPAKPSVNRHFQTYRAQSLDRFWGLDLGIRAAFLFDGP